jgi:hypothetical protein
MTKNNELERMWKERSWHNLRHYHVIFVEGLVSDMEGLRMVIVPSNFRKLITIINVFVPAVLYSITIW